MCLRPRYKHIIAVYVQIERKIIKAKECEGGKKRDRKN